jgi:hypothetical protein
MGIKSICKRNGGVCIAGFHHDAIRLKNGHTIAIGSLERMIPEGAQGSDDPVDIMGTLLIDLDEEFQVTWVWSAFDHLDISRKALGDEKCRGTSGGLACAVLLERCRQRLAARERSFVQPEGWQSPPVSSEQDWVIKVDYQDGKVREGSMAAREGGDLKSTRTTSCPGFVSTRRRLQAARFRHAGLFDKPPAAEEDEKKDDKDAKRRTRIRTGRHQRKRTAAVKCGRSTKRRGKRQLLVNADMGVTLPLWGRRSGCRTATSTSPRVRFETMRPEMPVR